jgi:hypothetical protein
MDTRRALLSGVAILVAAAACPGPTRYEPQVVPQVTAGEPERFGAGITLARPGALVLDLAQPAYVAVARFGAVEVGELVYPLDGREWLEFGYPSRGAPEPQLPSGRHRLELPLPWLRVDLPATIRRASPGDPCRYKGRAWACISWLQWRSQQQQIGVTYYSTLPAPDSLTEHHFVVLVSTKPWDVEQLRTRLDLLHDTRVTPAGAAQAAPFFLTAQHPGEWGAFATTVRIQGVR